MDIELNLTAANGSKVPYIGWVELNFRLRSSKNELAVPFLVTEQSLNSPLIGFNVIEDIMKTVSENEVLHQLITSSCTGLDSQTASKLNEGVVSKETVVLRRWGSSIQKFGFINGVDNVNWPPYRDSKS